MKREDFLEAEDAAAIDEAHRAANGHDVERASRRFRPVRFGNIRVSSESPYLVKNLIPREGITVIWGPPKCGKTFWCFDLAMHVALGWEYRGRRVQSGTVIYVACEGERGLGARIEAFRRARLSNADELDPPFYLLSTRLDLVADVDDLRADIRAALEADQCVAIIIDTLNRSIAGSESRDEDMSAYVKAADQLRETFRCAVIIIHHCGINAERPRGHTSLTGAADAQIAVKKDPTGQVTATVEYMKDGPEAEKIASKLIVVDVGTDDDGEAITSCVIMPTEETNGESHSRQTRLSDAAKIALDTLRKAIAAAGSEAPASNHVPPAARGVDVELWRRYYYAGTASDDQTPEARRKSFQRVRQQLQATGIIGLHTDFCWIAADD
jgi:hypothetical protein